MTPKINDTRFVFLPADDECTDDTFKLLGGTGEVDIQCAPYAGGYGVNSYGYDDPTNKGTFWVQSHGVYRSLDRARRKALEVAGLKP